MLSTNEKKILTSINFFPIFIIIVFSLILTYTFIAQNEKIFESDAKRIKADFMQEHKNLVKKDVKLVYDLIAYEQQSTLENLKQNIKQKVEEAHHIASSIYYENTHLPKEAITLKIKEALRHIRFNSKRGYYFIYELGGKNILLPTSIKLEGKNLWDLQDAKNNYTIRTLSKIAKNKKQGFHTWYWYKPNNKKQMSKKIGYTILFEPLNWFIGTGEYLVDFETDVKKNVLNRINQIQYTKKEYVFIVNYDGVVINHIKKNLINTNQIDLKDKNGVPITKQIITAAKNSEGFVQYIVVPGTQIGEPSQKISFVKGFSQWKWAIVSGFHPKELEPLLKEKEEKLEEITQSTLSKITMISIFTTVITVVLLFLFSNVIKKIFLRYRKRNQELQDRLQVLLSDKTKKLNDSMEMTNSYVAMTQTDLNGIITYASDNFCKKVGYKKSELIGFTHSIVRHPDNDVSIYEKMWRTIQSGNIFKDTIKNLTKDGNDFWFEILIYPDFDNNKNMVGYTALRIDITDRKRIEKINKNLEYEIKKAVESNREKDYALSQQSKMAAMGEMLENIAHQWRQPLSVISAAASGMKLQKDYKLLEDEQFYRSINSILNNTEHLSETINTFRDFFKSDQEKILINLNHTFSKTRKLINSKYKNSNIDIICNIEDVELVGLETDLIQVLMNILSNAKDALESVPTDEKKYIFVNIYKDKYHAIIKIKDNAGGIPPEILSKIFDPYFTTKHKAQGTGIGLYMSTEIISKHMNGELKVMNSSYIYEDKSFTGAEFIITLPLKEKKFFNEEIVNKMTEIYCYLWDRNLEKFLKINH
ncbi:MAG: cache domain-containing protein, partial [Campylobacteraceae bacterium]|nr:cache domain-containing protein [Campylobacteraceae bacterium]